MTGRVHTRYRVAYKVWATEAESIHRGGISIVWKEEARWKVEYATNYGMNLVSFTITVGWKRWYGIGSNMPPND